MKRFIDVHVPISACNLQCQYCYVTHEGNRNQYKTNFKYDVNTIKKSLTQKRLGGVCHFNICGEGETLIPNEIIEITKAILQNGHYIMIVTNGTLTNRFEDFCKFPIELRKRLGFKFSLHYLELKRKDLLQKFTDNVKLIKEYGMSYSIEMTPTDELEEYKDEIKSFCLEKFGALCHLTIPRNMNSEKIELLSNHSIEEFYNIWKDFDSALFDFKYSLWGKKRNEYCYAGIWSGLLNIGTGDFSACYVGKIHQNIFENPKEKIKYIAIGSSCSLPHCYNGHSFLGLGDIPSINTTNYSLERDRITKDGEHWLNNDMREFLSHKLYDYNIEFNEKEKNKNTINKFKYYLKKINEKIKYKRKKNEIR